MVFLCHVSSYNKKQRTHRNIFNSLTLKDERSSRSLDIAEKGSFSKQGSAISVTFFCEL